MLEALGQWVQQWGFWGAMLILGLEGMGLPLPVEVAFLVAGALVAEGTHSFWLLALAGWGVTMAGNLAAYGTAVWGGRPVAIRVFRTLRLPLRRLVTLNRWMRRHGLAVLLITRLLHWGFAPSLWLAGMVRMPPWRVLAVMALVNLVWVAGWLALGTGLLQLGVGWAVAAVAVLALLGALVQRLWFRSRNAGSA